MAPTRVLWGRRKGEPWVKLTRDTSAAAIRQRQAEGWDVMCATAMEPGNTVTARWCGRPNPVTVRLVRRYEHPTGNGWYVNIHNPRRKRYSKTEQAIDDSGFIGVHPECL